MTTSNERVSGLCLAKTAALHTETIGHVDFWGLPWKQVWTWSTTAPNKGQLGLLALKIHLSALMSCAIGKWI